MSEELAGQGAEVVPRQVSSMRAQFDDAISMADDIITKSYLTRLSEMDVVAPDEKLFIENANMKDKVRLIRVDEMVYGHDEYAADKFASVFGAMTTVENSVFLMIDSDGEKARFYMGVRCDDPHHSAAKQLTTLQSALQGQFPGIKATESAEFKNPDIIKLMRGVKNGYISAVSCVANLRDEETRENKAFLQGLEKFALSMRGKKYTAIILANSLPQNRIAEMRRMYEQIYTQISPFAERQLAYGTNESWNTSDSDTKSESVGTSTSESTGTSESVSKDNTASRVLKGLGVAVSIVGGIAVTVATGGAAAPAAIAAIGATAGATGAGLSVVGEVAKKTITTSENENKTDSTNQTQTDSHTLTEGQSGGTSSNLTLTAKDKSVISLMDRIDLQLERMREFESYGMWECSAYFIASEEASTAEIAAATYKAIVSGARTGVETSAVNSWSKAEPQTKLIHKYITNFMQPLFRYESARGALDVTAGAFVSGKELALHMGLPRHSVPGFPVIEHAEFAHEVVRYGGADSRDGLVLGKVYSMGREDKTDVKLDRNSLTMHTFITGSTGSGKSNTVYHILNRLRGSNIPFLVVEPAKGEYKEAFGHLYDVAVYGTNPKKMTLLRINPFSFPDEVHVLEHLDRLVELFNVCWPMYAAMPAILKKAMERAYEVSGWDLQTSTPRYNGVFPTFSDVLEQIQQVIEESAYSADSKGDYAGALLTRVESLTNGINGMLFASDAIADAELFDKSVIVDLSSVGSTETKSLIMGLLVMKLQEHRASTAKGRNAPLKHITVLEEAHNLLKRTSTEQSSESSNLLGKSVELLANSIAEMRTYGEGFIIADQSPGLLDMSAIRNTNTKIILRLPEYSDRELVGRAASLTDEQIVELSKLERGVAAVYQNDWVEPILVKIKHNGLTEQEYAYRPDATVNTAGAKLQLINLLTAGRLNDRLDFDVDTLERELPRIGISARAKIIIGGLITELKTTGSLSLRVDENFPKLARIVTDILGVRNLVQNEVINASNNVELTARMVDIARRAYPNVDDTLALVLSQCFLRDFASAHDDREQRERIYFSWFESIEQKEDITL